MSESCTESDYPCRSDGDEPCFCPHMAPIDPTRHKRSVRYSPTYVTQMRALGAPRFPLQVAPEGSDRD